MQTIGDANKGRVQLADEDKEVNRLFEVQRFDKLTSEANTTLVLQSTNLSSSLKQLVDASLILTRELAELGATTAKFRGGGRADHTGYWIRAPNDCCRGRDSG